MIPTDECAALTIAKSDRAWENIDRAVVLGALNLHGRLPTLGVPARFGVRTTCAHYRKKQQEGGDVRCSHLANDLPQPQPPGGQAPTKLGGSEFAPASESGEDGGCWL
jgi:hypothetical protein